MLQTSLYTPAYQERVMVFSFVAFTWPICRNSVYFSRTREPLLMVASFVAYLKLPFDDVEEALVSLVGI